jgi:hypothetical protein
MSREKCGYVGVKITRAKVEKLHLKKVKILLDTATAEA